MVTFRTTFYELLLHGVIIAVPFVVLFVLVLHRLAPSGVFMVAARTQELSPYINRILPIERAPNDEQGVRLIEDPAYFTVNIPAGGYTSVDVALDFAPSDQSVLELGALTDVVSQSYDFRPMMNAIIDRTGWDVLRDGDRVLLQRASTYGSIASFMVNPPSRTTIATYHADLDQPYREASYAPLASPQKIDVSLRGSHTFATYIKNETLDVRASYMDMNRTEGDDAGALRIWNEAGEVVAETRILDDSIASDGQQSTTHTVEVHADHLSEGVYTVEMSGTSDIFWRSITTPQRYVTFVNQLYIADDVGYQAPRSTSFVTTAKHLTVETFHVDSPRSIAVGSQTLALPESHAKIQSDVADAGLVAASTPVGDVKITGAGLFAFSSASFFNPYPIRLTAYTDLDREGIDYVLATYRSPMLLANSDVRGVATFDLAKIRQPDDTMKFTLSSPGIADTEGLRIDSIRLQFHKSPMTFGDVVRKIIDRL